MMPEELTGADGYLFGSIQNQLYHLIKMPKKLERHKSTYPLLIATFLGLMSSFLKWAKKSSQGAAS